MSRTNPSRCSADFGHNARLIRAHALLCGAIDLIMSARQETLGIDGLYRIGNQFNTVKVLVQSLIDDIEDERAKAIPTTERETP